MRFPKRRGCTPPRRQRQKATQTQYDQCTNIKTMEISGRMVGVCDMKVEQTAVSLEAFLPPRNGALWIDCLSKAHALTYVFRPYGLNLQACLRWLHHFCVAHPSGWRRQSNHGRGGFESKRLARHGVSGSPVSGSQPAKHEEVVAAKRTPIGQKYPVKGLLDGVAHAYASKIDRSAMWTPWVEHRIPRFNRVIGVFLRCRPLLVRNDSVPPPDRVFTNEGARPLPV